MNVVSAARVLSEADAKRMVGLRVPEVDTVPVGPGSLVVDASTGEVVAISVRLPSDARGALRRAVLGLKYGSTLRSGMGFGNESRIFGFVHRKVTQKREGCSPTALSRDNPAAAAAIAAIAPMLWSVLAEHVPAEARSDEQVAASVLPEWRISPRVPWTSGVVNMTSELPYHFDRLNFPIWSAMPVLRRGTSGGNLSIPEYGLVLEAADGCALLFRGHKYLHGVTPIKVTQPDGYRVTVVYYSLAGMKDCASAAVEDGLKRQRRTARERSMAEGVKS